jgi:hypothetical protein
MLRQQSWFIYILSLLLWLVNPSFSNAKGNETSYNNLYVNLMLGIEFRHPENLDVYQQGNDLFLAERLPQPKEWRFLDRDLVSKLMSGKRAVEPESYVIHIRVQKGSFDEINKKEKVLSDQNGIMMGDLGRFGLMKAMPIAARGWKGYETKVFCSVFDPKTGPHAAGGDCYWAIGSNGVESFVVDTLGDARYALLAKQVTLSIRFTRQSKTE